MTEQPTELTEENPLVFGHNPDAGLVADAQDIAAVLTDISQE